MKFNINQYVKVKLTPVGIRLLSVRHDHLKKMIPSLGVFEIPKTDDNGYVKFQLWELMEIFGKHVGLGSYLPFETEIEIPDAQAD